MSRPGTVGPPQAAAERLLFLMIALQERENRALTDALHDGPMQDITGILLSLASLRRGLPEDTAERIAQIETRLRDTTATLHRPPPPFRPGNSPRQMLELGLTQRVEGVLVERLYISLDIDSSPPVLGEVAVLLATVQLLLQESDPIHQAARALVAIRSSPEGVNLALRVAYAATATQPYAPDLTARASPTSGTPAPAGADGPGPANDAAADEGTPEDIIPRDSAASWLERLRPVAELLGAQLRADSATGAWSAMVRLPRRSARPR
ncbi:hypothetical protein CC117_08865 [Parafrankia colletiae]|uniref:Signal transduction histidine kinase subgroup 3 dimerisation and phosphoacceptor domain-containing protein n=1 Tax=Parafrankia colletiae TaxID=573497 RepID=A0A1S1RKC1_9ACTN|nr:hypothetical protein [Parafrankia colletiae]MCK9901718.1 hypothetical protein [Frankia sp. Cpl3]OHV45875.1 hypothetical protein CC117_08865 [Parafrankia colletiae]